MNFHLLNPSGNDIPPSPLPKTFHLKAPPGTDIWRKPPSTHSFNAPILYSQAALDAFNRVQVTVSGVWTTLFDQGGVVLELLPAEQQEDSERKWVKAGIEFFNGKPHVGVVACDRWADWTLLEIEGSEVTIEMEREIESGQETSSLWIYLVDPDGKRRPIREITWVFGGHGASDYKNCRVGVYAARPKEDADDKARSLDVTFQNFEIDC